MMITAEANVLKARRIFQGIERRVVNARNDSVALHELEQWFWERSLEAMRLMLEAYVALKGDGGGESTAARVQPAGMRLKRTPQKGQDWHRLPRNAIISAFGRQVAPHAAAEPCPPDTIRLIGDQLTC